jgi:toxin CcdB
MARFDVYELGSGTTQLVVDVQADLLDGLSTRAVVPLTAITEALPALNRLNPKFEIDGKIYVFSAQFIATVPTSSLRFPIENLSNESFAITAALDMLFQGF